MPILFCLLLILSLEVHAAPAGTTMSLDAQIQSLRMDGLEHSAARTASGQTTGQSELDGLFARFRGGRISATDLGRLVRQLIRAGLPLGADAVLTSPAGMRLTAEAREGLWYEIATGWYLRAAPTEARAALEHIAPLRRGVRFEHLQAKVATQGGARDLATSVLASLNRKGQASDLERYNLAVLMLAENASAPDKGATAILSGLVQSNSRNPAPRNLAAVTLGRVLVEAGDYQTAIGILKRVDNDSVHAPEAHYLLGRAHMAAGQPRKAIGFWEELARRAPTDPFIERAMMALPPALGALDATGEAVTRIAAIQKRLERAITDLSAALNELATPNWIDRIAPIAGQDRLPATAVLRIPAASYVLDQIASNRFQTAVADHQALNDLGKQALGEALERRRQTLATAQRALITSMIRSHLELRLGMLERELLDTRFEYALLLDGQAEQKR